MDYQVQSQYLELDELFVECEVRQLRGSVHILLTKLDEVLDAEQKDPNLVPKRPHTAASKAPQREINICASKLKLLQEVLQTGFTDDNILECDACIARLAHVYYRLSRISTSKTGKENMGELLSACTSLLQVAQKFKTGEATGNESITSLAAVKVVDTANLPVNDEIISIINDAVKSSTATLPSSAQSQHVHFQLNENQQVPSLTRSAPVISVGAQHLSEARSGLGHVDPLNQAFAHLPPTSINSTVDFTGQPNPINGQEPGIPFTDIRSQYPSNNTIERRPLSRSGVSYNGSPSGITIDMFLFQLDTITASMRLSSENLLAEIHTILRDVALQWYWTYRKHNPYASWFDLRRAMVERFQDRRTNYEIRRMVESRKQQAGESFLEFYNHVWTLTLQCRTAYRDEELIQILMTNMKPALQYHLTDRQFYSINELIKSCTAWEDSFRRFKVLSDSSAYSRRAISELSEGAYEDMGRLTLHETNPPTKVFSDVPISELQSASRMLGRNVGRFERGATVSDSRPVNRGNNKSSNVICFNCSDIGHTFQECRLAPTGFFCYRCGLKDTITPQCRRCAENQKSGSWRTGTQGPHTTIQPRSNQEHTASNTDPELFRPLSIAEKKPM